MRCFDQFDQELCPTLVPDDQSAVLNAVQKTPSEMGHKHSKTRLHESVEDPNDDLEDILPETKPLNEFYLKYDMTTVILGEGAFGQVRLATSIETKQRFAVKLIFKDLYDEEDFANFRKEIRVMMQLKHKNVVRLHDSYESDIYIFMVLEFLSGGDLYHVVEGLHDFTEDNVRTIARTLIKALKYCKRKGIIHRDIKPDNVLLRRRPEQSEKPDVPLNLEELNSGNHKTLEDPGKTSNWNFETETEQVKEPTDGLVTNSMGLTFTEVAPEKSIHVADKKYEVVLADFGLAGLLKPKVDKRKTAFGSILFRNRGPKVSVQEQQMQLLETNCGSKTYAAPEIIRHQKYSYKVDVWSLGILLYNLLSCGNHPFPSQNLRELEKKIVQGKLYFRPEYVWGSISTEAKDFLRKVIVVNPNNRLSYEEMLSHPWLSNRGPLQPGNDPLPTLNISNLHNYNLQRKVLRITQARHAARKFERAMLEDSDDVVNEAKDAFAALLESDIDDDDDEPKETAPSTNIRRDMPSIPEAPLKLDQKTAAEIELEQLMGLHDDNAASDTMYSFI